MVMESWGVPVPAVEPEPPTLDEPALDNQCEQPDEPV
jgi:hypothetical protein